MIRATSLKNLPFVKKIANMILYKHNLSGIRILLERLTYRCPQTNLDLRIIGGKLVSMRLLREIPGQIVSAGVGTDLDFELTLIKLTNREVIAIDPTNTSLAFYEKVAKSNKKLSRKLKYLNLALSSDGQTQTFYSGDGDRMASISDSHSIGKSNVMAYASITLDELGRENAISYLKMDIEGSEYKILESLIEPLAIPQVAIEFHHFCIPERTLSETVYWVKKFEEWGYVAYDFGSWAGRSRNLPKYTSQDSDLNVEILFIKKDLT